MKRKGFFALALALLLASSAAAADFDWVKDFNALVQADPAGFRTRIAARFQIGDAQITAVLGNVSSPADAYIVLRLGEMSRHPADYVLREYKASKGKGWGVIAKNLGIKPGSEEFHALKRGQDLYSNNEGKAKGKKKH
ncbi:MAG: putative exported protein [candidate division NC10 bacterium]|nr:putative exported protein [candidate division NC10 bacterium]